MNARQKKFAEYYAQCGNTVQSALKAGYSGSYANKLAHKLLENIGVAEYIRELTQSTQKERILTAIERQELLSGIARNEEEKATDRIKAMDVLNKMTGEYIERLDVSGGLDVHTNKLDAILEQLNEG